MNPNELMTLYLKKQTERINQEHQETKLMIQNCIKYSNSPEELRTICKMLLERLDALEHLLRNPWH